MMADVKRRVAIAVIGLATICLFRCAAAETASPPSKDNTAMRHEEIRFVNGDTTLAGVLDLPAGDGPFPAIVIVHGAGAARWTSHDQLRQRFVQEGFACMAWDKPGVGGSSGDFTKQNWIGGDRATEVLAAVRYLRSRQEIDSKRIGLWGISQAGWVIPQVLQRTKDIAFAIMVSCPSCTVLEQDLYYHCNELRRKGCTEENIQKYATFTRETVALMREGGTYADFQQRASKVAGESWIKAAATINGLDFTKLTQEQYTMAKQLVKHDHKPELDQITVPVLAIFGEIDTMVNPWESMAAFEALTKVNSAVTVKSFPNADHFITLGKSHELAPGYLQTMSEWLTKRLSAK